MRPDSSPPLALTFILPTRNRRQWVGRAIESCLQAHQSAVHVEVLVIDGNSTDGSFEWVQQRYLEELPDNVREQMCFRLVTHMDEVFNYALLPVSGDIPIEISPPAEAPESKK